MSEHSQSGGGGGPRHRSVEIALASATTLFGLIVIYGSIQAGITWGIEGPRAGFFPFYLGLLIVGGSLVTIAQVLVGPNRDRVFAEWEQLRLVLAVIIPAGIYVALIPFIGMYVASALLILVFMMGIGRYNTLWSLAVGLGLPIITFVVFERLFLIPLPKGPLERLLGF
ncbi:MAG TPA: tripartite tricarboxylate transporter TctB family protein [Xanthobacteraceae bacterium]|nr:tripartite tricarboxylate transporter TctB family protein [Xanthobacteraceae bacterium]